MDLTLVTWDHVTCSLCHDPGDDRAIATIWVRVRVRVKVDDKELRDAPALTVASPRHVLDTIIRLHHTIGHIIHSLIPNMTIKRKRATDPSVALCATHMDMDASSPDASATSRSNPWSFANASRIKSSDWGYRTRKRFRDNRPDEHAIHGTYREPSRPCTLPLPLAMTNHGLKKLR